MRANPRRGGERLIQELVERVAFRVFLPFVLPQGIWVKATAPRFAAAAGPRQGSIGEGAPFRLLAIGDSIVAGVGVPQLADAMPGQLARALAGVLGRRVDWQACGVSGIGTKAVREILVPRVAGERFECVFVSVGVNDVTGLRSTRYWRRELAGLIEDLRKGSPDATIVISGLPPMHGFPLLPQPLRAVFGMRARTFDLLAEKELAEMSGVRFLPNRFEPEPRFFASDGYHPSEESCAAWAKQVVAALYPA